jgi:hypothetical protein
MNYAYTYTLKVVKRHILQKKTSKRKYIKLYNETKTKHSHNVTQFFGWHVTHTWSVSTFFGSTVCKVTLVN